MSTKKDATGGTERNQCGARESGERPADLERRLKQIEMACEESEAHFRQLLDHSRNCIAIYEAVDDGRDFIFKDINRAAETIEDVRREDLVGRSLLEIFPGVREFGLFEVLQRVWRTGVAEEHPVTLYTDDRISGYRQNHVFRLESGDVVAVYDDVTERIESRETRTYCDHLLHNINDAVISTDEEFHIRSWNAAAERIYQWREEEVLGQRTGDLTRIEYPNDEEDDVLSQLFASGRWQGEVIQRRKDGSRLRILASVVLLKSEVGETLGVVAVNRDVTEQYRAARSKEAMIRTAMDGFWVIDETGRILEVNDTYCRMIGYSRQELLSMTIEDLEVDELPEEIVEHARRLQETGTERFESRHRCKDGTIIAIEVGAHFLDIDDGVIFSFMRDITEAKLSEKLLGIERNLALGLNTTRDLARGLQLCLDAALQVSSMDDGAIYLVDGETGALERFHDDGGSVEQAEDGSGCVEESRHEVDSPFSRRVLRGAPIYHDAEGSDRGWMSARPLREARSFAVIPLKRDGRVIGAFQLTSKSTPEIRSSVRTAIETIVGQAGNSITRLMAEEALRGEQERYRLLADNVTDVIWTMDLELNHTYLSPSVEALQGYTPEEALSVPVSESITPHSLALIQEILTEELALEASGGADPLRSRTFELEQYHKDGSTIWTEERVTFLRDAMGRAIGFLGVSRNITGRKRIEQQTQRLNRLRESLLGPGIVDEKLIRITQGVVDIFGADFARIWIARKSDRCDTGCVHTGLEDGQPVCEDRERCLHLAASAGRYTHINGRNHSRMPYGSCAIGRIAAGYEPKVLTNDVTHDSRIREPEWARRLGLVSFAAYQLGGECDQPIGVLALFSRQEITPDEDALLAGLAGTSAQVVLTVQAEQALRESENRFRALFEQAAVGVAQIETSSGRFVKINRKFCDILGCEPDETQDLTVQAITHADDLADDRERMEALKRGDLREFSSEVRYHRRDGSSVWVNLTVSPLWDAGQEPDFHVAVVECITDRKQAEEALRESEGKYRVLIESAPDGILLFDAEERRFVEANDQVLTILGRDRESLLRASWEEITAPDRGDGVSLQEIGQVLEEQALSDQCIQAEWLFVRGDGETVPTDLRLNLMPVQGRKLLRASLIDITERKRAEEDLVRLGTAIEQASEIILVTDPAGGLIYANPAFERVTGYTREELTGCNLRDLYREESQQTAYDGFLVAVRSASHWQGNLRGTGNSGTEFETHTTLSPVLGRDGSVVNLVAVVRDVSEVSRLEARLRQSQKMEAIGTLAGGIAHDFNNVLHAMLGYADLALDDMPKESRQHGWLTQIQEAGIRASKLVNQILAFSRETKVERSPIDVHVVVEEVMDFLRGTLPATIDISCQVDQACPSVVADATEIHQVMMNLCTNAYHAMPDKVGRLEVVLRQVEVTSAAEATRLGIARGRYAQIIVRDTGMGMDLVTLERAFDPYFTTRSVGEGTGMGLAIVHGIAESMQGTVVAESLLGQGSTISVFLPLVAGGRVESAEPDGEDAPIAGNEMVLFVDDEEMITRLGQTILKKHGYGVSVFTNPEEALADFKATPEKYDIVITDQTMPGMTGLELTRAVRALRPEMPIILCTGNPVSVEEAAADAVELPEVLAKPLGPDQLVHAIRLALRAETTGDED